MYIVYIAQPIFKRSLVRNISKSLTFTINRTEFDHNLTTHLKDVRDAKIHVIILHDFFCNTRINIYDIGSRTIPHVSPLSVQMSETCPYYTSTYTEDGVGGGEGRGGGGEERQKTEGIDEGKEGCVFVFGDERVWAEAGHLMETCGCTKGCRA